MPRFLLLLSPEHRAGGELSAAEVGARTSSFVAWVEELRRAGVLREGARLDTDAVRVSGAAIGTAAAVGLFFVVEAPDWDAALSLAARCPGADPGSIDVYRLDARAEHPPAPAP